MKIKCIDGKIRNFSVSKHSSCFNKWTESECLECGHIFGTHDTKVLKPKWKAHVCPLDDTNRT